LYIIDVVMGRGKKRRELKMFKEITRSFLALVRPLSIKATNIRYTQ
jgi:hypothetical protein